MHTLRHISLVLAVALSLPLAGCNDIVTVENPNAIDPGN